MKISIIVTTYNRANHLNRGLYTVLSQDIDLHEVIIIDDGGNDHTAKIVDNLRDQFPKRNIKYIYNHNFGYTNCCLAKNIGIRQATGELLIFTEPEVLHIGEVIKAHLNWHKEGTHLFVSSGMVYFVFAGAAGKLTLEHLKNPELIPSIQKVIEWKDGYQPQAEDIAVSRKVSASYCASVRKKDVVAIGGYDERYKVWGWEDIDVQSRLSISGVKCVSDNNIKVVHLAHGYTGCFENWEINKKLHENPDKPMVANQGKEWGIIK